MTTFLLVRHASAPHVGRLLAGRSAGVHLNDRGREEAAGLAEWLRPEALTGLWTSPRERAVETARAVADVVGTEPEVDGGLDEVDFGAWTGMAFEALEGDPAWDAWNRFRSTARPPGGESMVEVLERALTALHRIREAQPDGRVAVVSHCDVIRPLLTHFAGMPLDHLLRLQVGTASISAVEVDPRGPRILYVNRRRPIG